MARLAELGRDHSRGGRNRPGDSAGKFTPVGAPNPNARSTPYCSSGWSRAANFTSAMLLETRIASASVSDGSGRGHDVTAGHRLGNTARWRLVLPACAILQDDGRARRARQKGVE